MFFTQILPPQCCESASFRVPRGPDCSESVDKGAMPAGQYLGKVVPSTLWSTFGRARSSNVGRRFGQRGRFRVALPNSIEFATHHKV